MTEVPILREGVVLGLGALSSCSGVWGQGVGIWGWNVRPQGLAGEQDGARDGLLGGVGGGSGCLPLHTFWGGVRDMCPPDLGGSQLCCPPPGGLYGPAGRTQPNRVEQGGEAQLGAAARSPALPW